MTEPKGKIPRVLSFATLMIFVLGVLLGSTGVRTGHASEGSVKGALREVQAKRTGRVLVTFNPGVSGKQQSQELQSVSARQVDEVARLEVKVVAPSGVGVDTLLERLRRNPNVLHAEAELVRDINATPDDPRLSQQWGISKIQAPSGWNVSRGSSNVKIAIVDTGIDYNHPDLKDRYIGGYDFVDNDPYPRDDVGHGTHVAGIAAAAGNNAIGIAGTGWYTRILAVRSLGRNGGTDTTVSKGITWATDKGASVINLSLGGYGYSDTLARAVKYAQDRGVLVVAAAGNDATSLRSYPAALPDVVGVAASTTSDTDAYFSNYGDYVDISAPGTGIYSTMPTYGVDMNNAGYARNYAYVDGTSMASPFVAGAAAVIKAKYPGFTSDQIWARLKAGANDIGAKGNDPYTGHGRLNLFRSLAIPGQAYGVVKNARTGAAMPNVRVALKGTARYVLTDSYGRYRMKSIAYGSRTLVYSKTGFQSYSRTFSMPANGNVQISPSLKPLARLTGYVRDAAGAPLADATVSISGTTRTGKTNSTGYYRIVYVPLGTRTVTAKKAEYYVSSQSATFEMGTETRRNFILKTR